MEYTKDLSIVISLYNEEESLHELVKWIESVMVKEGYTYEIIMVDDGSRDGSWKIVKELSSKNENIRGISFRRNYGKSAALFHGFKAAEGRVVVTMDADLQDSPEEIPEMYRMVVEEGYDIVSGWKNLYKEAQLMAVKDVKSTAAHIKQGDIAGVYYFYGADIVQTEALTKQLIRKATGGNETMALTKYDGKNLDLDELASSAELFPMMSEYNCIWIHDLNAESCREDQLKKLMEIISNTGDQTVIVFSVTGFDVEDGKKTPTPKNKKLIDKIAKLGTVCETVQRTFPEIAKSLMSAAQRRGCILQRKEAEFLTARCMGNTVQLQSELEKLCAYANGGEITEKMIESLVSPAIETTVYALAKAVIALRPAQAMAELDRLYSMRTSRTFIVHAVASGFIDLYRAAVAWRNGHSPEEMQKDFGYRFDFVVKNAFHDCRKIAPERLRACISVLRDLEQKLNSSSADERVLLESAIVKMLEIASGRMEISI